MRKEKGKKMKDRKEVNSLHRPSSDVALHALAADRKRETLLFMHFHVYEVKTFILNIGKK